MSIRLECENCGKLLRAPDTAAGKRVKCPGCGAVLAVPATDEETPGREGGNAAKPPSASSGEKKTNTARRKGILIGGGILLLLILGVGWLLMRPESRQASEEEAAPAERPPAPTEESDKTLTVDLGNGTAMEFVLISPGSFMMGCETRNSDEKPVHKVTISKPFYIGKYEVTQRQWQAIAGDNPSKFKNPQNPVEQISWEDSRSFIEKLNEQVAGHAFRMPTEAEWEYACRAGTTTEYCCGDDVAGVDAYGWHTRNSGGTTHPVGEKKPNAWGLYDMHGNVWENCSDWYDEQYYASSPERDPTGAEATEFGSRVARGGSFGHDAWFLCSSARGSNSPIFKNEATGLRLVCAAEE